MTTTTKAKSDKRPTHVIYLVQGEDDPRWTKIAAAFAHKDGNGFTVKETEFHKVTLFNGLGKAVAENKEKGDMIAIEGRLHYTRWQDSDGNDRYGCEIIADRAEFY